MKTTDVILDELDQQLPGRRWLTILTVLALTGLADGLQLLRATGLNRDSQRRTMETMQTVTVGVQPLFRVVEGKLSRANLQGRAPKVYQLAEGGASLLRHLGYVQAHASRQTSAIARAHALDVLNLYLAAVEANLPVQVEKILRANEQTFIRPDCLVTLSDGQPAIFEVEQVARPDYLPRMSESLQNKLAYYISGGPVSPYIRMNFNLKPGKELDQSMNHWQGLIHLLRKENGGTLPFTIWARSMVDFLADPDWSPTPDPTRWRNLTEPLPESRTVEAQTSVPELPQFSSKQNALLLQAQLQWLNENKTHHHQSKFPDPGFFEVMEIIYLASYKSNASPLERAAFPQASIYLLGQYLTSNPELREALNQAITRGGAGAFWNVHYVQQRMQQVIDIFLEYHGFRSDGALLAIPVTVDWNALQPKSFAVQVKIETAELLPSAEYGSARSRIEAAENALAWVLRALFAHAARIGLKTPKFW